MDLLTLTLATAKATVLDVAPIVILLTIIQALVLRRPLPNLKRTLLGIVFVVLGMTLFLVGLEEALFPIGRSMARQLTELAALGDDAGTWHAYALVYAFAAAIGFATTIAEPALIAVAWKANQVSGGAIPVLGLRLAVAVGVAIGVAVGCFRIVTGAPLPYFIVFGYLVVLVQTMTAPKMLVPLAFDSGGVTTSTVTVPVVTALGLGLAGSIPGRDPLTDGFGLIAFASLFPMMTVLAYGWAAAFVRRQTRRPPDKDKETGVMP